MMMMKITHQLWRNGDKMSISLVEIAMQTGKWKHITWRRLKDS